VLERIFRLRDHDTGVGRELTAGATTFLTMAYIVVVNPDILTDAGMDHGAVITVTILAAALGTLLAGLWANVPYAMAPGMGLNAFFAYGLVLGEGVAWPTALGVVMVSGVAFLVLTVVGFRRHVVAAIPEELRLAIGGGIGLFIALIGLQKLGLVVADEATMIGLGRISMPVALGLAGLVITLVLHARRVPGALLLGIAVTAGLGMATGHADLPAGVVGLPADPSPVLLKLDIAGALAWGLLGAVFSFMFIDLFDSLGTIVACSYEAGRVRPDGRIDGLERVLEADAVATVAGALLGTSTTTTYIESGAGIAAGGRTGLAAVATALLLLATLLLTPLIVAVPPFATAPALLMVGVLMFRNVGRVDFDRFEAAAPAFLTMVLMPLTYSIATGLAFGFIAHVVAMVAVGRGREVRPVMWGIAALSVVNLLLAAG
jgi:AGZA family xanthine/uracil permease-like MFS transporter